MHQDMKVLQMAESVDAFQAAAVNFTHCFYLEALLAEIPWVDRVTERSVADGVRQVGGGC